MPPLKLFNFYLKYFFKIIKSKREITDDKNIPSCIFYPYS